MSLYAVLLICCCEVHLSLCSPLCPEDMKGQCESYRLGDTVQVKLDYRHQGFQVVPNISFPSNVTDDVDYILDLSHNRISIIDSETFSHLQGVRVTKLYLNNNQIKSIAAGALADLAYLEWLSISHNKLEHLEDDIFLGLEHAKLYLELKNIGLTSFPATSFKRLRKVFTINLDDNEMGQLPDYMLGEFETEDKLFELSLENNSISDVSEKAFHSQNHTNMSVSSVSLKNNQITNLNFLADPCLTVFSTFSISINLRGNPLICDCDLYSITNSSFYDIHGTCAQPDKFRDIKMDVQRSLAHWNVLAPEYHTEYGKLAAQECVNSTTLYDVSCAVFEESPPTSQGPTLHHTIYHFNMFLGMAIILLLTY